MHGPDALPAAQDWFRRLTFGEATVDLDEMADLRTTANVTISVCLPALDEQDTIGHICGRIRSQLVERGVVDQLVVIDSGSSDNTAARAADAGATVHTVASILPEIGVIAGKGEALWRSLAVAAGDIVVYLDSDVRNFDERFVLSLVEPLLRDPTIGFVKAFYERPLGEQASLGGGRVTELVARPLLNLFYPELSGFVQPLAGEYAARLDLLRRVPFFCGYAVEVGLLIDVLDEIGLEGMAQVDLGERIHRNRATAELGPMAFEIIKAVLTRVETRGGAKFEGELTDRYISFSDAVMLQLDISLRERPPMETYPSEGSSGGGVGGRATRSGE